MSNPLISPDGAWIVGSIVTAGPAYIMARRSGRKAESTNHAELEHVATRAAMVESLNAVIGPLNGRLDEMHATMADMRDWQAEHATDHAVSALQRIPLYEHRKGS